MTEKFKQLGLELIDIGLYEGVKGLEYLRHTQIIEDTDKYVNYD